MTEFKAQARRQGILFLAALLAPCKALDYQVRCAVLGHALGLGFHQSENLQNRIPELFRAAGMSNVPGRLLRPSSVKRAETRANLWFNSGVWTIDREEVLRPHAWLNDTPRVLFAFGNRSVLDRPTAAVLNSRKPRRLSPHDPWIAMTKELVKAARSNGCTIVSSYGTSAYTLVTVLTKGSPIIVVCDGVLPFMDSSETLTRFMAEHGDLFDMEQTLFVSGFPAGRMPAPGTRYVQRDHLVAALSSMLMVAEVRPRGNMASVLGVAEKRGIPVRAFSANSGTGPAQSGDGHKVSTSRKQTAPNSEAPEISVTSQLESPVPMADARHLVLPSVPEFAGTTPFLMHYTRSCAGPWPGQTIADYYRALIEDRPGARHSGFDTLVRILEQRTIRGSRKLTRGATDVICFTELFPEQMQDLNEWRPGLLRWAFEPYGIALRRDRLFELGARPVIYAVEELFPDLTDDLAYLFQLDETDGKSWSAEREWRIKGDLAFSCFSGEEIFVIVPQPEQAAMISERFGLRVGVVHV